MLHSFRRRFNKHIQCCRIRSWIAHTRGISKKPVDRKPCECFCKSCEGGIYFSTSFYIWWVYSCCNSGRINLTQHLKIQNWILLSFHRIEFYLKCWIFQEREEITNSSIKSYSKLFAGFGANIVTGSLDVLEALGKKTFEKLTVSEQVWLLL